MKNDIIELTMTTNLAEGKEWISWAMVEQLPFATASALTKLAQLGQFAERADLPNRFVQRRQWIAQRLQIQPAYKQDPLHRMHAGMGTTDWFMPGQEEGATRVKQRLPEIAHRLSFPATFPADLRASWVIPLYHNIREVEGTWKTRTRADVLEGPSFNLLSDRPAGGKRRGVPAHRLRAFVRQSTKDGQWYIFRREGLKSYPLKTLFALRKEAQLKPIWEFTEVGTGAVEKHWDRIFEEQLTVAWATRRGA